MKLSVIIVNYNVEYFLEQCLLSVLKASKNIETEVFVVDNNSVDGSVNMIKERFPEIKLIESKINLGFSKANNLAIKQSCGEYVLLLNPDTIVDEDTFEKTVAFMDKNPDGGGLGVMMINGKGDFLPESKRGLPTPKVSFYKIFGLSKMFPKSKKFGKYHLTYLDKNKIHKVDVLSGAFMLLRKKTLDKIGLLDETFFMYGEDIDLSYRIRLGGYENYYFPETKIIHYKGESTKKSSVNYVFIFYNAMIIFAKKHFKNNKLKFFIFFIKLAIYFRAFLAIMSRFIKKIIVPLSDIILIAGGIFGVSILWQNFENGQFPKDLLFCGTAAYTIIWLLSLFFNGAYDKPTNLKNIISGALIGSAIILIGYSLLPETLRFSRAIILFSSLWVLFCTLFNRFILHFFKFNGYIFETNIEKRIVIIGSENESERVKQILDKTETNIKFLTVVAPNKNYQSNGNAYTRNIEQLDEICLIHRINEIIFCAKDISAGEIINTMSILEQKTVSFKIAPPETLYIIGSQSIDNPSDQYVFNINNIAKPNNLRRKRLLDICASLSLLISYPLTFFFVKNPFSFLRNIFYVLIGIKTWVSFNESTSIEHKLPKIKKGILNPVDYLKKPIDSAASIDNLNILYARDYRVWFDIQLIFKAFNNLGRKKF